MRLSRLLLEPLSSPFAGITFEIKCHLATHLQQIAIVIKILIALDIPYVEKVVLEAVKTGVIVELTEIYSDKPVKLSLALNRVDKMVVFVSVN